MPVGLRCRVQFSLPAPTWPDGASTPQPILPTIMQVMGEVGRARAAERVSSTAKELGEKTAAGLTRTATAVSHQVRRAQGVRGQGARMISMGACC